MADVSLTQTEANALLAMEKHRANDDQHSFPLRGESLALPLESTDKREHFLLDIRRGRIDIAKVTMQNRARQVIVLARLDMAGHPHRNPDGEEIACPHLHIYREGYGAKWAASVPAEKFPNTDNAWATYQDFLTFCNITKPPHIGKGLFE